MEYCNMLTDLRSPLGLTKKFLKNFGERIYQNTIDDDIPDAHRDNKYFSLVSHVYKGVKGCTAEDARKFYFETKHKFKNNIWCRPKH